MTAPTPDDVTRIAGLYQGMYSAFETKTDREKPLLLAHYTSVQIVEQILKNEEIWFANPLYMNDLEEMRAGLFLGNQLFPTYARKAGGTADRTARLTAAFTHFFNHLANEAALDTYVFCVSEQAIGDTEGLLSMWREYGTKGNGAALVFNTQKLNYQQNSPILIGKIRYTTAQDRESLLQGHLENWATITRNANIADDHLHLPAYFAFDFVKSFSLLRKHAGFREEQEWRAVYIPERDPNGYLKPCLDYFIGPRGLEPKLKYKFGKQYDPEQGKSAEPVHSGKLEDILEFIMLGPTISSPLSRSAFIRMLERIGKAELRERVFSSTIPLRPQM
jgi:hypothetical protein